MFQSSSETLKLSVCRFCRGIIKGNCRGQVRGDDSDLCVTHLSQRHKLIIFGLMDNLAWKIISYWLYILWAIRTVWNITKDGWCSLLRIWWCKKLFATPFRFEICTLCYLFIKILSMTLNWTISHEILTHICSCHNVLPLSTVPIFYYQLVAYCVCFKMICKKSL